MVILQPKNLVKYPEVFSEKKHGWDIFTEETAWYIYDFFKYELNAWEKLIFYGYYINNMTLKELAEPANCTFQRVAQIVAKIEKRLGECWKNKHNWKVKNDSQPRD